METRGKLITLAVLILTMLLVVSTFVLGAGAQDEAVTPRVTPATAMWQYMAKFVCGYQAAGSAETEVKPGNYLTAVNIANPEAVRIDGLERVLVGYAEGTAAPPVLPARSISVRRLRTLEITCADIWAMAGVLPGTFLIGHLHLGFDTPMPVSVVYTSQTNNAGPTQAPNAGAGISIEVEYLQPLRMVIDAT